MSDESAVEVEILRAGAASDVEALARILPQVSSRASTLTAERVESVLGGESTIVFVARRDGTIVGMALLAILATFTGRSGYVEEVVVDEEMRGRGIGLQLIRALLDHARSMDLTWVDLTSRPSRVAANRLYASAGFTPRETNCYRHHLR